MENTAPPPLVTRRDAYLLTLVLAAGTIALLAALPEHRRDDLSAVLLAVIGAIYVGFALSEGGRKALLLEVGWATVTVGLALAGLWASPCWLVVGLVGHGLWDLLHHRPIARIGTDAVPDWYPPACVLYDWILAAAVLVLVV